MEISSGVPDKEGEVDAYIKTFSSMLRERCTPSLLITSAVSSSCSDAPRRALHQDDEPMGCPGVESPSAQLIPLVPSTLSRPGTPILSPSTPLVPPPQKMCRSTPFPSFNICMTSLSHCKIPQLVLANEFRMVVQAK